MKLASLLQLVDKLQQASKQVKQRPTSLWRFWQCIINIIFLMRFPGKFDPMLRL